MSKLPYMQFYPGDWIQDTRALSLAAKGTWIDLLCAMWRSQNRGTLTLPIVGYSRLIGADAEQAQRAIKELTDMQICDTRTECNGDVTLICRRMIKDERERDLTRLRVQNHRNADVTQAALPDVTRKKRSCNASVTPYISEVRSQKSETEETPKPPSAANAAGSAVSEFNQKQFAELWSIKFKAVHGVCYVFQPKDFPAVKTLLLIPDESPGSLTSMAEKAWRLSDKQDFLRSSAMTVAGFSSQFVRIRDAVKRTAQPIRKGPNI